ncbi:MAG: L-dopachrome tautomerase-related protein [Pseudomonadota bacterium]
MAALSILSLWSFPAYANDWSPMDVRESGLEIIAELAEGPGNIAVGPGGRVFLTMHQAFGPSLKLVELLRDGSTRPYPDSEWAYAPDADGVGLHAPLGLQVDQSGVLWVIDNAAGVSLDAGVPKVFAWDTREEALHRVISIPAPYSTPNSFINDLAVDRANNALYLADVRGTDGPALVVIDLETGEMRRRMVNDASFQLEDDAPIVINDLETRNVGSDGKPVRHRSGLNPITLDPNAEWVYYGAMHGTSIYRIRSADLRDFSLTDTELATRVERYGDKPVSDGITIDAAGNVYITDLNGKAIGITKPDGTYETLVTDELMIWPDSVSAGPNGHIWVAINQLNLSAPLNGGTNISVPPFYVARVPAVAPLIVGR